MKISVAFVRLQHAHITRLMAEHANIIGERRWQPSWVDDGTASGPHRLSFSRRHLSDVLLSRAVTVARPRDDDGKRKGGADRTQFHRQPSSAATCARR